MRSPAKTKAEGGAIAGVHKTAKGQAGDNVTPTAALGGGSHVDTADTQLQGAGAGAEADAKKVDGKVRTGDSELDSPDSEMKEGAEEEAKTDDEVVSPNAVPEIKETESAVEAAPEVEARKELSEMGRRMCEADYRAVAHIEDSDDLESDMSDMLPKGETKHKRDRSPSARCLRRSQ